VDWSWDPPEAYSFLPPSVKYLGHIIAKTKEMLPGPKLEKGLAY
jgi:hypothetical protein